MVDVPSPTDIYNEPENAFVADFIGESNIFHGRMTGPKKAFFCGAEFSCVDPYKKGTVIDAVVRPEDIKITDALRRSGFDTSTKIENRLYSALSEELGGKFDIDNSVI